ncbi:MAG: DegT/DnrJ/EryC1/StrS family aminotransferase, partial [Ornithinimicrobium sp.]
GPDRDQVMVALRQEHQVGSGVYYPIPNHELVSLARFAPERELVQTRRAADEVISLPVHPSLSDEDLERIVAAVNTVVSAGAETSA